MHRFFYTITTSTIRYMRFIIVGFLIFILSFLVSILFGSANTDDVGIWKAGKISKVYADAPSDPDPDPDPDPADSESDSCESDDPDSDSDPGGCGDPGGP